MATDIARSQRDAVKQLSPPFLTGDVGEKLLYDFGLAADGLLEKLNQAVQARMPGRGDPSALPLLGADRLLSQGPSESNEAFARRLQTAFDAWQAAGSNRAILQQVLGYVANPLNVSPTKVPVGAIVGTTAAGAYATWDVFYSTDDTTNPPHHVRASPANWNWDGTYAPHQAFLILYFPLILSTTGGTAASIGAAVSGFATVNGISGMTPDMVGKYLKVSGAATAANNGVFQISAYNSSSSVNIASPAAVSDANNGTIAWTLGSYPAIGPAPAFGTPGVTIGGNPNITIGLSVSNPYVVALRNLVRLWKSASTFFPWIIISFAGGDGGSGVEFSPNTAIGNGNPDGTWGTWAQTVSGRSVPSRVTGISPGKFDAFVDGTAIYLSSYVPTGT